MTTIRVMILEDEPSATAQLVLAVKAHDPEIEVIAPLGSVREAAKALAGGLSPDLLEGRVKEVAAELAAPSKGEGARPRERILARRGMELLTVPVERVAWFMSEHRLTIVCEKDGAKHMVDETLGELEETLDPRRFFRLNRQFLAQVDAVKSFRSAGKGRLSVLLEPRPDDDVVVSQERAAEFRGWMEGR